jgi:hypothetical protein
LAARFREEVCTGAAERGELGGTSGQAAAMSWAATGRRAAAAGKRVAARWAVAGRRASRQAAATQGERATASTVPNRLSLLRRVDGFRGERKSNMGYEKGDVLWVIGWGRFFLINSTQQDLFQILVVVLVMGSRQPKGGVKGSSSINTGKQISHRKPND